MNAIVPGKCQRAGCANSIPERWPARSCASIISWMKLLCARTQALTRCREGRTIDPDGLQWLLSDALAIVKNLEEGADEPKPEQRDRMLELLLILANLHEYVAHHSVQIERPA